MKRKVNTPLPPQKISILGRKRYSVDANAVDVIESSFNDCWRAIERLWVIAAVLMFGFLLTSERNELLKMFHNGIKTIFQYKPKP